jgi:quaternary ammonium compound-resistance protein SugE
MTPATAWTFLVIAGLLEVCWAVGLKVSNGFTRPLASVVTIALMLASFYFLARALKVIPVGTGYAVWTGIGSVGAAAVGMIYFKEPVTALRLGCIALIVAGIVGLKVFSPAGSPVATP